MSVRGIEAGRAFVRIGGDDSELVRTLRRVQGSLRNFGASIALGGSALLGAGLGLAAPLAIAVESAADAQEALNRFRQVFGDQADAADEFAQRVADALGRSKVEIQDAMSSFQSILLGQGFDSSEALEFSKAITQAALDLASFNNISDPEAFQRILSALSGSTEVLEKFGVNLKVANLDKKLQEMFGVSNTQAAEAQKVAARIAVIQDTLARQGASGDAERTAGSYVNLKKAIGAALKDIKQAIGGSLLRSAEAFLNVVLQLTKDVRDWVLANKDLVVGVAAVAIGLLALGGAIVGVGLSIQVMAFALGGLITLYGAFGAVLGAVLSPLGLVVVGLAAAATQFVDFGSVGKRALDGVTDTFATLRDTADKSLAGVRDAFATGNLDLAARVATAGVQVAWGEGMDSLFSKWIDTRSLILTNMVEWWTGLQSLWSIGIASLHSAWLQLSNGVVTLWDRTTDVVAGMILEIQGLADDSLDVDAAKDLLREQRKGREDDRKEQLDSELDRIQVDLESDLSKYLDDEDLLKQGINVNADEEKKRLQDELDAAKSNLDAAIKEAADGKAAAEEERKKKLEEAGGEEEGDSVGSRVSKTMGVTSGFRIAGVFGADPIQQQIAQASQETADNTKRTHEEIKRQRKGVVFT